MRLNKTNLARKRVTEISKNNENKSKNVFTLINFQYSRNEFKMNLHRFRSSFKFWLPENDILWEIHLIICSL